MELIVPAAFETGFLDAMGRLPIGHLYGSLAHDPSLRASGWLPGGDLDGFARLVAEGRRRGLAFYYALNVHCLGNREYTAEGQRWLVERLGGLVDAGVEGVVLSNPYLVKWTRARFPSLRITVSTAAAVDSVDKARFFESCGADLVYLPEYVNRDFRLLREIRRRVGCRLALLANVGCLLHCPIRAYHIDLVSHSGESQELGSYVDWPLLWCTREKSRDAGQMLKAPWIRPEDLGRYEELGYHEFKLAGREMDRPWIERAAHAYAARRYDGDLNDLVLGFDHLDPFGRLPVRIPNRALDGFLDFFERKHDCRVGCRDCRYCDDFAAEVASGAPEGARFAARIERWLERIEGGAFRTLSGR